MVSGTSKGTDPALPGGSRPSRQSSAEKARQRMQARKRPDNDAPDLTKGAAAAERASAGMGTDDADPAAWLFGDSLGGEHSG